MDETELEKIARLSGRPPRRPWVRLSHAVMMLGLFLRLR
jgi:hypothetical protein